MCIRRFSNLEFGNWDSLRSAVNQLIDNGTYDDLVRIHSENHHRHRIHTRDSHDRVGTQRFLPWHRAYLIKFERELREIDDSLSIPYWYWEADRGDLSGFSDSEWSGPWERTPEDDREPWTIDNDVIQRIENRRNYIAFTRSLEWGPHDTGHNWIGGHMARWASPTDPAFWFHHAQVDRIWALWQQNHPNEIADLSGDDAELDPWDEFDIDSVNNISDIGDDSYEYVEPSAPIT